MVRRRGGACDAHPGRLRIEAAAVGGHRLDDAEGELGFVGELAGVFFGAVRRAGAVVAIDAAETLGDLFGSQTAGGRAEGVADRHAKEGAEKSVFGCVSHCLFPCTLLPQPLVRIRR
jgi:hypothetical protein